MFDKIPKRKLDLMAQIKKGHFGLRLSPLINDSVNLVKARQITGNFAAQ